MPGPIIKQPLQKKVQLDSVPSDLDPDRTMFVVVRQATQREVEEREELFATTTQKFTAGTSAFEVEQRYSYAEQKRKETYLTLADCNIVIEDDSEKSGARPLFTFAKRKDGKMAVAMSEDEFELAWGLLPAVIADAIHDAVLQINPQWDPKKAKS